MKQKPKFVTKLFAAIDGYADIKAENEQQALSLSRSARDVIKPMIEHHNGVWMHEKNGEIFANFKLPEEAVTCAVAIQKEMSGKPDMNLRIGIHTGDIKSGIGTGDIVASKIAGSAALGGICISGKVYASIQNSTDVTAEYLEDVKPDGVEHPVSVYGLAGEGLNEPVITSSVKEPSTKKLQPSIVVLPFDDISPDKDNEYFSDGLTEEIITDLSHVHELHVISRTSAMRLKGTQKDMKTIIQDLNVQYVLEGSVRKAGNNLRITAQLIDAVNDKHLWAEKYSGTMDDVFDIQEKVSRSIVDALKVIITPDEEKQIAERPIDNVQAYECYLRAMREMYRGSEVSLERALRDLQMGLDIMGDNVLLFAGMGSVYCNFYEFGIRVTEETLTKAEEYAFKVLRLEPNSALSYNLLGRIERFRGSAIKALKHFKQALDIDPNDREALFCFGIVYNWQVGKPDSARPIIEKLIDRDPLSPLNHLSLGQNYWLTCEFDNALKSFNNMLKLEPDSVLANFFIAYTLLWSKQYDKAYALIDRMAQEESSDQMHKVFTGWLLFLKYALNGEKSNPLELLNEDVRNYFWHDADLPWLGAGGFALIDEKKEAIRWLEHSINKGNINYPLLSEIDPFLENIRGEERFKKLMERVKYEWENFEI